MATKELQSIVRAGERARELGRPAALITVFKTSGSTYRRAGARMLVLAAADVEAKLNGADSLGSISGRCLEDDARERALETTRTGRAVTVCYDTTSEADILLGSGLGCRGIVHVLIQPLLPGVAAGPLFLLARAIDERRAGAVITVCAANGSASVELGQFLWLDETGRLSGTLIDPALIAAVSNDGRAASAPHASTARRAWTSVQKRPSKLRSPSWRKSRRSPRIVRAAVSNFETPHCTAIPEVFQSSYHQVFRRSRNRFASLEQKREIHEILR